jgi:transcriptional regulator with XRE-family HTH domain
MMKTFVFTIIASGLDPAADDFENRFFEAGCDDATIAFQKGLIILEFARDAENFSHAITSAFEDVQKAGAKVERFEPDYLVSLSDIAERCNLSRTLISMYCKGERGDKAFPSPIVRVTSDSPLYDWVDVSRWMYKHEKLPAEAVLEARMVREANYIARLISTPIGHFGKQLEERLRAAEAAAG